MQSSEIVLYNLSKQAMKDDFQFNRLYRHLYNEDFYITAYNNLNKNTGSAIKNSDVTIQAIIASLQDESYQPNPIRHTSIPTITDRLVQEVCRMVLVAIYEPKLSQHTHSFRPKRSCHTALAEIQQTFTAVNWLIEGNIHEFFTTMNHHLFIKLLRKHIKDEKWIRLMWKFLKAGYMDNWQFQQTYSGTPQGKYLSPVMAMIYLNELDAYIKNDLQPSFKAIKYVRYANAFIIGINGSKADCKKVQQAIANFLNDQLQLTLSAAQTSITHRTKNARFLNYDISIRDDGRVPQSNRGRVHLRMPNGTIENVIVKNKMVKNIDAKQWDMLHRPKLVGLPDLAIVERYNRELLGLYHYYALAENVSQKMGQLHHVMSYSCLKTLANKYKSTVPKMKKALQQGKYWGVTYQTTQGEKIAYFYHDGFKKGTAALQPEVDQLPNLYV